MNNSFYLSTCFCANFLAATYYPEIANVLDKRPVGKKDRRRRHYGLRCYTCSSIYYL